MDQITHGADESTRLQAVQASVRTLAKTHDWFADAIRAAFDGYLVLGERFQRETMEFRESQRSPVRELLTRHLLTDPAAESVCVTCLVEGLCPIGLAERLAKHGRGKLPKALQRESAAAALAALDRGAIYQARDLPEKQGEAMAAEYRAAIAANTHSEYMRRVLVKPPETRDEPANPRSLDR